MELAWSAGAETLTLLVALLGFAAAAWRLADRERYVGWTDEQLSHLANWPQREDFTPTEKAALRLAETVTRDANAVSDEQFAALAQAMYGLAAAW